MGQSGQGLSQDLETGCPKLAIVLFFKEDRNIYSDCTTINMYLLTEIRYNILKLCHGNCIVVEKLQLHA